MAKMVDPKLDFFKILIETKEDLSGVPDFFQLFFQSGGNLKCP